LTVLVNGIPDFFYIEVFTTSLYRPKKYTDAFQENAIDYQDKGASKSTGIILFANYIACDKPSQTMGFLKNLKITLSLFIIDQPSFCPYNSIKRRMQNKMNVLAQVP